MHLAVQILRPEETGHGQLPPVPLSRQLKGFKEAVQNAAL